MGRIVKSRQILWAQHVAHMVNMGDKKYKQNFDEGTFKTGNVFKD
jgi:hypothetical protein